MLLGRRLLAYRFSRGSAGRDRRPGAVDRLGRRGLGSCVERCVDLDEGLAYGRRQKLQGVFGLRRGTGVGPAGGSHLSQEAPNELVAERLVGKHGLGGGLTRTEGFLTHGHSPLGLIGRHGARGHGHHQQELTKRLQIHRPIRLEERGPALFGVLRLATTQNAGERLRYSCEDRGDEAGIVHCGKHGAQDDLLGRVGGDRVREYASQDVPLVARIERLGVDADPDTIGARAQHDAGDLGQLGGRQFAEQAGVHPYPARHPEGKRVTEPIRQVRDLSHRPGHVQRLGPALVALIGQLFGYPPFADDGEDGGSGVVGHDRRQPFDVRPPVDATGDRDPGHEVVKVDAVLGASILDPGVGLGLLTQNCQEDAEGGGAHGDGGPRSLRVLVQWRI